MIVSIQPSVLSGTIYAPASKSVMQRVCAAALIRKGRTVIHNPGYSNDDKSSLNIIRQLGANIKEEDHRVEIESKGIVPSSSKLNFEESGLAVRMFTPIAALSNKEIVIAGEGSLLDRPMNFFEEVFPLLNVEVKSNNGKLPLHIKGPLQPRNITVDGSISSQFLTGLLFAYSAANAKNVSIKVNDLVSKPYIDLTLQIMNDFGLKTPLNENYSDFYFDDSSKVDQPLTISYTIEGDWSGASFFLVAAAIKGNVTIRGLLRESFQADKKISEVLSMVGADVVEDVDSIKVSHHSLHPFEFDATDCPDLFPPLVALAANCKGLSKIHGLQRLKFKESDRGVTLQQEFAKLNTKIELKADTMLIHGNETIIVKDPQLNSHNDHRIAMACAIAGLHANVPIQIKGADAVKKSYPEFWDNLKSLNADLSLKPFTTDNTFRL